MALRVNQSVETKNKLSNTLRNWLPVLQTSLCEINESIKPFIEENPLVEVVSGFEESFESKMPKMRNYQNFAVSNSRTDALEALSISKESIFDKLYDQINSSLFPTPSSFSIAKYIIENLDEYGYFEGDISTFCKDKLIKEDEFYKVQKRFTHLEPVGIGAFNLAQSFEFQLDSSDIKDEAYDLALKIIYDLENIHNYSNQDNFSECMRVINSFKNPPIMEYMEESAQIVADIMIYFNSDNEIEVKINDEYYPQINIDTDYGVEHEFINQKLKEARGLIDALAMRKATLYKIGLMIVEYQYDFFIGGDIKPLTLKTLADEFGHNPSTISRAIANKYIACDRGIFAMKEFFTTAIDEDVSNATIKEFLSKIVQEESKTKPLSDMKILDMIQEKFKIKMVRRTIAKYRKQLNIAGSSERKKLYQLKV